MACQSKRVSDSILLMDSIIKGPQGSRKPKTVPLTPSSPEYCRAIGISGVGYITKIGNQIPFKPR